MINNSKCEMKLSTCIPVMDNDNCKTYLNSLYILFALENSEGNIDVKLHCSLFSNGELFDKQHII